jgi:hypothetical protein
MKTYSHAKKMQEAYFSQSSIGLTLEEINLPNHQVEMRLNLEEQYQNWSHSVKSWLSLSLRWASACSLPKLSPHH